MSLSVGIVGLPNVGKSTLFNALLKKQVALAANYPFATVEPNVGIVGVPDGRLNKLAEVVAKSQNPHLTSPLEKGREPMVGSMNKEGGPVFSPDAVSREQLDYTNLPPMVPATIEFVDIAGLVAGAHKGEGLGSKFLAHIREVDLVAHVLRSFGDENVVITGAMDPVEDLMTVRMELLMKDVETVSKIQESRIKNQAEKQIRERVNNKLLVAFEAGKPAHSIGFTDDEMVMVRDMHLLTMKPEIFVVNVGEEKLPDTSNQLPDLQMQYAQQLGVLPGDVVVVSAKIEAELAGLEPAEQAEYMESLGIEQSGIEQMARVAYGKLGLISFLTAGEIECRAWTIRAGTRAPQAAGVIHTDFEKKFIKADVIEYYRFVEYGGWKRAREVGKVRMEGRDYVMQDGDVVEFRIGA